MTKKRLPSVGSIQNPHDLYFKTTMMDIEMAKKFFELYLPESWKARFNWSTLQLASGEFVDPNLRQHLSDILYSVQLKGKASYIYLLVEHISQATPTTAFQTLRYQISAMHQHMKQGHKKPPIIIPIMFYRGKKSPSPLSLDPFECFDDPELARKTLLKSPILVDLTRIPDEELEKHAPISVMEILQKNITQQDLLDLRWDLLLQKLHELSRDQQKAVLEYVMAVGYSRDEGKFVQWFNEQAKDAGGLELMQTLGNYFTQKGIEQGMQQGMQAIAEKLRTLGVDDALLKAALAEVE